jgi:hypothetical protein
MAAIRALSQLQGKGGFGVIELFFIEEGIGQRMVAESDNLLDLMRVAQAALIYSPTIPEF